MPLPDTRHLIEKYELAAKKRFGQHFLLDRNILQKIISASGKLDGVNIIEIGPGPGALTSELIRSPARHVTAIEIDDRMIPALREIEAAAEGKFAVLHRDALEVDIAQVATSPRAIIANLPYNVATPLLIGWLKAIHRHGEEGIRSMTLMFQKEVAERLVATPSTKDYGRLAIMTQWLCEAVMLFDIPPGAFSPPPKIVSSVVRLTPRKHKAFEAPFEEVETFLAAAFSQRRKMLRKTLAGWLPDTIDTLQACRIDPTRRAETLSVQEVGTIMGRKKQ